MGLAPDLTYYCMSNHICCVFLKQFLEWTYCIHKGIHCASQSRKSTMQMALT